MALKDVSLDDKYDLTKPTVFTTGTQALIRLCLMQHERDAAGGLSTAGYVTGYRGSPLGSLDQQFWRAREVLEPRNLLFRTALNEDLAATALWGTQQAEMRGEGRFDGVFGLWYGKGPGADRSGDAFRHANLAGTSRHGGVLALMGDDHTCESSTTAHQSEFAFVDAMIPILNPAGVQEVLDFGILGLALSRFAGTWAALKCVKDTIESTAIVDGRPERISVVLPEGVAMPATGLNIRPGVPPLEQEALLHEYKLPAAMAFLAANGIDRVVLSGGRQPRLGVATTGKSYLDALEALDALGIDEVRAADFGLRLFKIGATWPLDPAGARAFADGLETIVVVEEKRALIESQLKEILYGMANAPRIIGKRDEEGEWLFPAKGALDANDIALAIGRRILAVTPDEALGKRVEALDDAQARLKTSRDVATRIPYFCPGCPHNSSTHIPEGSRAYAGIGCHYMVQWMDRKTEGYTQMGGEGANWVGEAPFSRREHVFQNIGDGTFNHSGLMAIRAAAAAGVNVTYKILYNDAVAMTGGQPNDGGLPVDRIAAEVAAEGARRIAVVTDEPEKYPPTLRWPEGTTLHHRDDLLEVERDLREIPGLTVLIYDQTCAAEKRRRRKRGNFPDPDRRVVINEAVCEGCGDCGVQSNCVAIQPVETEYGRKRQIDQSACNKDFSCLKGFCPSFVTVHGGKLRRGKPALVGDEERFAAVPEPERASLQDNYAMLVTGIGGTGVVTIGAVIGMAAHMEGKGCGIIDMAGLAQKGGAVTSHIRLAPDPANIHAIRVPAGAADLVLGCDMVVVGSAKVLTAIDPTTTTVVVNTHEYLPGDFARDADYVLPTEGLKRAISRRTREDRLHMLEAQQLATSLLGDAIATNMFMLGYAYQLGAIPISAEALVEAIRLNGVAVAMNEKAFRWGRLAAHDRALVEEAAGIGAEDEPAVPQSPEDLVEARARELVAYQGWRTARRYRRRMDAVMAAEIAVCGAAGALTEVAARNLYKLTAIKDEYEVARLFSDGAFEAQLKSRFEKWDHLSVHLAPPFLARRDRETGHLKKTTYGPWMLKLFPHLARLRILRGTPFDPFGYTAERRLERRMLAIYAEDLKTIAAGLSAGTLDRAVALAGYPRLIRGFGHVKEAAIEEARSEREARLAALSQPAEPVAVAAE